MPTARPKTKLTKRASAPRNRRPPKDQSPCRLLRSLIRRRQLPTSPTRPAGPATSPVAGRPRALRSQGPSRPAAPRAGAVDSADGRFGESRGAARMGITHPARSAGVSSRWRSELAPVGDRQRLAGMGRTERSIFAREHSERWTARRRPNELELDQDTLRSIQIDRRRCRFAAEAASSPSGVATGLRTAGEDVREARLPRGARTKNDFAISGTRSRT